MHNDSAKNLLCQHSVSESYSPTLKTVNCEVALTTANVFGKLLVKSHSSRTCSKTWYHFARTTHTQTKTMRYLRHESLWSRNSEFSEKLMRHTHVRAIFGSAEACPPHHTGEKKRLCWRANTMSGLNSWSYPAFLLSLRNNTSQNETHPFSWPLLPHCFLFCLFFFSVLFNFLILSPQP